MYYKCVINAKRFKVREVKIGVEIWMSPSKGPPTLLQVDPVDAVAHRIFMYLAFLWAIFQESAVVPKCLFSFWSNSANRFANVKHALMKS